MFYPDQDAYEARTTDEYRYASAHNLDAWVPACGGLETPYVNRDGLRVIYCYNFAQRRHAYIDCATDCEVSYAA